VARGRRGANNDDVASYLVRCLELGREQQARRGKLRRDLAAIIAERVPGAAIELSPGRVIVEAADGAEAVLAGLPGVTSVAPCRRVARDALAGAVEAVARARLGPGQSFAVRLRRAGGAPRDGGRSMELVGELGARVAAATGARVDLEAPDVEIGVELRDGEAFVFDRVVAGVDRAGPAAPRPAGEICFLADQMLGRLATWLRLIGYDTATVFDLPDSAVVRRAAKEGRVLLTQDGALAAARSVTVLRVEAREVRAQLGQVIEAFALAPDPARFFTRCARCNVEVEPVAEAAVADRLPPAVRHRGHALARCPGCDRLYWRGGHVERILAALADHAWSPGGREL
jgi:uncharacterized protein